MSKIKIPTNMTYLGIDVVKSVIEQDKIKYQSDNIKFKQISNTKDFYNLNGDLLIVKEVLQHWPKKEVMLFLKNVLPNFKYIILNNRFDDSLKQNNRDIPFGNFTCLDLEEEPYCVKFNYTFNYKKSDGTYLRVGVIDNGIKN